MPVECKTKDIAVAVGQQIVAAAAIWKGTPYALVGKASVKGVGGDCSGTTYKIFDAANCPYTYQTAAGFRAYALTSGLFRKLPAGEQMQDGDILSWPNHMAVYSTFASDAANAKTDRTNTYGGKWVQQNDMWTASHPGGPPYGTGAMKYWRPDAPTVFRYQR